MGRFLAPAATKSFAAIYHRPGETDVLFNVMIVFRATHGLPGRHSVSAAARTSRTHGARRKQDAVCRSLARWG